MEERVQDLMGMEEETEEMGFPTQEEVQSVADAAQVEQCPYCGSQQLVCVDGGQQPYEAATLNCDCPEGVAARKLFAIRQKVQHRLEKGPAREYILHTIDQVAEGTAITATIRIDTETTYRVARTTNGKIKVKRVNKDEEEITA